MFPDLHSDPHSLWFKLQTGAVLASALVAFAVLAKVALLLAVTV
jgi:hypothetical protein